MITFLSIVDFLVAVLLIFIVAIQSSKGEGLGALGGGATLFSVKNKGLEAMLDKLTGVLAVLFLILSLVIAALE